MRCPEVGGHVPFSPHSLAAHAFLMVVMNYDIVSFSLIVICVSICDWQIK
jgi:hypothetical protein